MSWTRWDSAHAASSDFAGALCVTGERRGLRLFKQPRMCVMDVRGVFQFLGREGR